MVNNKLLSKANVVGYGKGYQEGELVTTVFVTKKLPLDQLRARDIVPETSRGLPTKVIETGEIVSFGGNVDKVRPLVPGYSIGHERVTAGTLGAIVLDKDSGKELLLSNNHVMANSNNAEINDNIIQPGVVDGGTEIVAKLYNYQNIKIHSPTCPVALALEKVSNIIARILGSRHRMQVYSEVPSPNNIDAAVALPERNIGVNRNIKNLGIPDVPVHAALEMLVHKSGRTTCYTQGTVSGLEVTVKVKFPTGFAIFENQIVISPLSPDRFSAPGDSGSLILTGLHPVGLLFAGSETITIANRIDLVLDILGITF